MDYKANEVMVEKTEHKSSDALALYASAWEDKKQKKEEKKDA